MEGNCKVLVVEPNDRLRDMLVSAAERQFDVESVCSGTAMREALSRGEYAVVIINMGLPRDDTVALGDYAARHDCSVIAVPETARQFVEAAARRHYILIKPLTPGRIIEVIERAMRRSDAECAAPAAPR